MNAGWHIKMADGKAICPILPVIMRIKIFEGYWSEV